MEIHFNPAGESPRMLLALAAMLTTLANASEPQKIDAVDSPDVGADAVLTQMCIRGGLGNTGGALIGFTAQPASTGTDDLAAAFGGAGNVAGNSLTVPSPPPALIGANSPSTQTPDLVPAAGNPAPDLAAAFGGSNAGPNVAPSTPTNGAPPAPSNGALTAGVNTQVETDGDGLPWNDKIHSSNKKKSATGKWMARRNVPDDVRRSVEAQLRAAMSVGNVQAPPSAAPPPPVILTPPPLQQTTPAAAVSEAVTFAQLLPRVTSAMAAGTLTAESAAGIAMEVSGNQINNVAMLAVAPACIPAFWARLDALGVPR